MSSDDPVRDHLSRIGQKGGQARSATKVETGRVNAAKARAMKALYRMNPSLRPDKQGDRDASQ